MSQRQKEDINLYQGDTRGYEFTLYTETAQTTRWNFSTASAAVLSVKKTLDGDVLFSVSAASGDAGNDWTNGVVRFVVPATSSALLDRNGKYDVQITVSGAPITPVYGDVVLQRQVTA